MPTQNAFFEACLKRRKIQKTDFEKKNFVRARRGLLMPPVIKVPVFEKMVFLKKNCIFDSLLRRVLEKKLFRPGVEQVGFFTKTCTREETFSSGSGTGRILY